MGVSGWGVWGGDGAFPCGVVPSSSFLHEFPHGITPDLAQG